MTVDLDFTVFLEQESFFRVYHRLQCIAWSKRVILIYCGRVGVYVLKL